MPEFFEVKRIRQYLTDHQLIGQSLKDLTWPNKGDRMLKTHTSDELQALLIGQQLTAITTKAKYTFFQFGPHTLVCHYRFIGIPHIKEAPYTTELYSIFSLPILSKNPAHIRLTLSFSDATLEYVDTRCLSAMSCFPNLLPSQTPPFIALADDLASFTPLSYDAFMAQFNSRRQAIKDVLLDQSIAPSGIGNYLACEILVRAKLWAGLRVCDLTADTYSALISAIYDVYQLGNQHVDYDWFQVFNRSHCQRCQCPVQRTRHRKSAQTTHYCPRCQPHPLAA